MAPSLCLLLSLLPLQAPSLDEDPNYTAGLSLFEDFEYEKAVFRFEDALLEEGRTGADRASIYLRLGMTWAELRREEKAVAAFASALAADPYAALPADASPKIKEMLDGARRQLREQRAQKLAEPVPPARAEAPVSPGKPSPDASAESERPPMVQAPLAEDGLPWVLLTGGSMVALGVVGSAAGGILWGAGLGLRELGNSQEFQSDALAYDLPARGGQYVGQAVLAVGLVALMVGGGVALVSIVLE